VAKADKQLAEIVAAAQALEDELADLEALSSSLRKVRLNGEKALARATAELQQTLALPERMAERLQAVVTALNNMQARQQAALEPLAAMAAQLQERTTRLQAHMETFGSLGKATGEVNALLATSAASPDVLARAEQQLQEIAEGARALFEATRADDFPDVAREADVLKQRLSAMSKRLREQQ
jgi:hypothetical protein